MLGTQPVRVIEIAALPTLFLPRLQLQPPAASADAAWLSLAVRDIFAQRLAADVGHAALLVPRIGAAEFSAAATAAEPPLPLSPASAELAAAAAAAASAWVYRTVDADPWPRTANAGHATRRAAHLLQEMCDRMAAAHTPSLLAAGACAQLLGDLAHWQRGLASAHFELAAQPNCSRRQHDDAPPGARRPPLAQRVAACQAAAAAERSAWLAANPLISSCAGRSIVPYYRRWRWAAAPAAASGWRLDWAGADTPLPGSEPVAPLPPPVQLYPTPEGVAALRRSIAEHNESGQPGPFLVPDDVVVYEFSHGRCELLHAARRSWAGLGRHHVAFSTVEDARIEAVTCRPIRPDWAAVSGDGATSSGISGGGVAGIVIAALVAAAVAYTVRSYRNTGRLPFSSAPRSETSGQKLGEATAALDHVSPVVVAGARGKDAGVTIRQFESAAPRPERFAAHPSGTSV
jgi:hypothetical protein